MAHLIDETTGKAAIAYVGKTPWHGLGVKLDENTPLDVWMVQAGLNYDVIPTEVLYYLEESEQMLSYPDRKILVRSDTKAALSIVGKGYKIVQPSEIINFFSELCSQAGFTMEVAGALEGGRKIWGLAKVSEGANIVGHDEVKPYVLLSTSYDLTLSTIARMTSVRTVCNNTLTMALKETGGTIRIPHNTAFKGGEVMDKLGIVTDVFDKWSTKVKEMAESPMTESQASDFVIDLIDFMRADLRDGPVQDKINTPFYGTAMTRFFDANGLVGADLDGGRNKWRMLNVITQHVDHERGSEKKRLNSAWFGPGEALKNKAFELLAA